MSQAGIAQPDPAAAQEPLCGHASSNSILAYGAQGPTTAGQWLRDIGQLLGHLPANSRHVLNICHDRYHFLVGFGACLLSGRISLQPSSLAPGAVQQLLAHAPDAVCLHDGLADEVAGASMPVIDARTCLAATPSPASCETAFCVPTVDAEQVVAQVFTSGSTGVPVPHAKTWGKLCRNVRAEALRLHLAQHPKPMYLVGTVPSQHMFGFESVMLLALVTGCSLWRGRPFYPADVAEALGAVPAPRMLVTTPVHLRVLTQAPVHYPPVDQLLCATAPLSLALAQQAEACFKAPLHEIYGSTETGQIAVRRPTQGAAWTLFPDVVLEQQENITWASGGHVEGRVALSDVIEPLDATHFALHGRSNDMVNIAGKRSSLAYLNSQLAHVAGVVDGAFFLPQHPTSGAHDGERLCLVACAPGMHAAQLMAALRPHIESVFLPRPLILLDKLPRNETGKLPHSALQAVYENFKNTLGTAALQRQAGHAPVKYRWQTPADHAASDGHFPGNAVLPGALLLERCVALYRAAAGIGASACTVESVKFLHLCRPGDTLDFVIAPKTPDQPAAAWTFRVLAGDTLALSGTLRAEATATGAA